MRDRQIQRWAIAGLALGLASQAFGIWDKYSPFFPTKTPPPFRSTRLEMVRHGSNSGAPPFLEFFQPAENSACLRVDWAESGYRLTLRSADGTPPFVAPLAGSPLCDAEAASTDLNGDAIADFIVVTHSGGNGLAAQITTVTFLLSSPNRYIAREIFSFDAAPTDLVDLNGDGRPEFVHGMSVWGDQDRDGRAHNYWVYNLLGFSGTDLVSANSASREFPKWIAYTSEPNHQDSTQLTAHQRERQWRAAWQERARDSETNLFPDLETVATEQGRTLSRER